MFANFKGFGFTGEAETLFQELERLFGFKALRNITENSNFSLQTSFVDLVLVNS